jgi:hypothetical protein
MAHPRLYWGAVGNDLTPALLELPISRNHKHGGWEKSVAFFPDAGSPVTATRTYEILNENSWARSLHFLAAWLLVATGAFYILAGIFSGWPQASFPSQRESRGSSHTKYRAARDGSSTGRRLRLEPPHLTPPRRCVEKWNRVYPDDGSYRRKLPRQTGKSRPNPAISSTGWPWIRHPMICCAWQFKVARLSGSSALAC